MFNHSKTSKKSENDAPEFKEQHYIRTPEKNKSETKKTDLLCGYLFSEEECKLYAVSGFCKNGKLDLRLAKINVGREAILQWSAYLIQTDAEQQDPTNYSDLLKSLKIPEFDEIETKPQRRGQVFGKLVFNFSRTGKNANSALETSLKKYGDSAVSEISARRDKDDLIIETKVTLLDGMTHIKTDGITNYLFHAINQLIDDIADRALHLLETKRQDWGEDGREPIIH